MIFIIFFVIGLSIFQFFFLNNILKIISFCLNLLYLLSAILTYLLNPGTLFKLVSHCYSCGICVIGIDHHCGVFGKCIARKNIFWFYCFIVSTFLSIFACVGTLVHILTELPI